MKKIVVGLLMLAVFSNVAFAQSKEGRWENLENLRKGPKVQVERTNHSMVTGKLKAVSSEEIAIEIKGQTIVIKHTDIQKVETVKGRGRNLLLGASIGTGIGLGVVAANRHGDAIYSAMAALPVIAGGGVAAGALLPTHSTVYVRP